ncbi:MAG: DUF2892 domain-containing protein [Parafilimonas sp.]
MKANMGTNDKTVRTLAAVVISVLFFANIISGTAAIILLIVAGIFIVTSLVSFCPIYHLIGISTCKKVIQSQEK